MEYVKHERVKIAGNSERHPHRMGNVTGSNSTHVWVLIDGQPCVLMFDRNDVLRPSDATYRLGDKYVVTSEGPYKDNVGVVVFADPYYVHLKFPLAANNVTVRHEHVRPYRPEKSLAEVARDELDKLNHETDRLTADLEAINHADQQKREDIQKAEIRLREIHENRKATRLKIQQAEDRRSELEAFLKTAATLP